MPHCSFVGRCCDFVLCREHWDRAIRQREEALGDLNRYYFGIFHGREPLNEEELFLYYIESGGATNFRQRENSEGILKPRA